jgi:Arm DNA-binding domain
MTARSSNRAGPINRPSRNLDYQFGKLPEAPVVKIRFADAAILGLKPRNVRYDVQDSEDTGLLLRVSPQGRKTWMVSYRSKTGIKQQKALGKFPTMRVAEARRAADLALTGTLGSSD